MYKYFTIFFLVFNSFILAKYEDSSPALTTIRDLEILKDFESLLYQNTSINILECNQLQIVNFIKKNKIEKFDYNKLLVKVNAQINNSENYSDEDGILKDRDRANIQLRATYPIFDKKTDLEIKRKKVEFNSKTIESVSKYCTLKNELSALKRTINLLNLKQIRAKAREDSGQIYLDDRISLIEEIINKKNEFNKLQVEYNTIKLQLLNIVIEIKRDKLKELL